MNQALMKKAAPLILCLTPQLLLSIGMDSTGSGIVYRDCFTQQHPEDGNTI
ncbi:MAG: hypothetical protein V4590_01500 [Bacteroidota bacterium]